MTSATQKRPLPRIALFGFYEYRNFGDDLMAVLFGRTLQAHRMPFRVYRLDSVVRNEFGFDGADTIEALLDGADAIVYGGGGAFLPTRVSEYDATLDRLRILAAQLGIPIYMFSVGGDGKSYEQIAAARRALLEAATFVTFRNREDQLLLDRIGQRGAIYNDVVWQTGRQFTPGVQASRPLTIGIDSSVMHDHRGRRTMMAVKLLCRLAGKRYRFVTIVQSGRPTVFDSEPGRIKFSGSVQEFIHAVAAVDIIVTSRLHLGVVGMSFDIPVVLLYPLPKASLLFSRLGLQRLVFDSRDGAWPLSRLLIDERKVRMLKPSATVADFAARVDDSANHFRELERLLLPC